MNATGSTDSATGARLNVDRFDAECLLRDATSDASRAELVGVDRATVWRWRTGRQQPSLDTIAHLAATFAVSVDDLIDRSAA